MTEQRITSDEVRERLQGAEGDFFVLKFTTSLRENWESDNMEMNVFHDHFSLQDKYGDFISSETVFHLASILGQAPPGVAGSGTLKLRRVRFTSEGDSNDPVEATQRQMARRLADILYTEVLPKTITEVEPMIQGDTCFKVEFAFASKDEADRIDAALDGIAPPGYVLVPEERMKELERDVRYYKRLLEAAGVTEVTVPLFTSDEEPLEGESELDALIEEAIGRAKTQNEEAE